MAVKVQRPAVLETWQLYGGRNWGQKKWEKTEIHGAKMEIYPANPR